MENKLKTVLRPIAKAIFISTLGIAIAQNATMAADVIVDSEEDDNGENCTLRQAIDSVNLGANVGGCSLVGTPGQEDSISFANNLEGGTVKLVNGPLLLTSLTGINIEGSDVTVDGGGLSGVMTIETGSGLAANSINIVGGESRGAGGGILVIDATLNLSDCTISGNSANRGGGIYARGSTVSISYCSINSNRTTRGASALRLFGGTSILDRLTINNNQGQYAGAISANGFSDVASSLTISNSTISNNSASTSSGGVDIGINTSLTMTNTTISGNSAATKSAAIRLSGGSAMIINSTISDNESPLGATFGALQVTQGDSSGTIFNSSITIKNTIIANTVVGAECYVDPNSTFNASADSIIEDGTCSDLARAIDPSLTELGSYGGPNLTHALNVGSPAIGIGNSSSCPDDDQRGVPREANDFFVPVVTSNQNVALISLGDSCDAGSFEFIGKQQGSTL